MSNANEQSPSGEMTDGELQTPPSETDDPNLHYPFGATTDADDETPGLEHAGSPQPPTDGWAERLRRFTSNPTRAYASLGVVLGVLFGVTMAAISWHVSNPEGPYDLGVVTSSAAGLKGHLFTRWDKAIQYRLEVEPSDPDQRARFALAVANPPRPLSIEIQLKDAQGFVLCSRGIVLKIDRNNAGESQAQEAQREQGKDVFKNEMGPDGKIAGLGTQGELPCSRKAYESTSYWSFVADFPSLAEQKELSDRLEALQASQRPQPPQESPRRKKVAPKAAAKPVAFLIEGDDAIVEFDPIRGVIETSAGKIFFFDRAAGEVTDPRWQNYPANIHYRCDQSSECTITRGGLGALRARMRK